MHTHLLVLLFVAAACSPPVLPGVPQESLDMMPSAEWPRSEKLPIPVLTAVTGTSKNDVWVAGNNGYLAHKSAAGWALYPSLTSLNITALAAGTSPIYAWILVAGEGRLYLAKDDGSGRYPYLTVSYFPETVVTIGNKAWLAGHGYGGNLTYLHDDERRDFKIDPSPGFGIFGMTATDRDTEYPRLWVVGDHGMVKAISTLTYSAVDFSIQSRSDLRGIWGIAEDNLWIIGTSGLIAKWQPQQTDWQTIDISKTGTQEYRAIWGDGHNVYAVGEYGTVLRISLDGQRVEEIPSGTVRYLYSVWGDGEVLYVAGEDGLFRLPL